jgi:hypothetical protein
MKRLLLVVISSAALSAWGQTSLAPAKTAAANNGSSRATVIVRGNDGTTRLLEVPDLRELIVKRAQDGCPVQIVNASLDRPAEMVLTAETHRDSGPTLHLNYENWSGKDIDSVVLTGWLKVKESPYQLDAVVRPFSLTLSRKALLGKDVQAAAAMKVAAAAIGLDRVELSQVFYSDGTTWKAEQRNCVFHANDSLVQAEAR